ncbi:Glycosyltransferase involved in cell wall bisynthesis [Pseudobutyrivibrio sp. 49]|uniref:glycosyltransferase n=1 Tax=Pseudobutyrivibrio sp. 49 TaxID=1855344 RepID=UPI000887B5BE|nr:glycosyltransferase [Pseudobutyrivibrio sp. 49]SDH60584.1 Glycosyltransferase involved in cell wall bisynthesis [Pseudobutyrivibrio sp. 49]
MSKELVSIIVPIYNGEAYIDNLFYQFENQTYKNLELVFVDDGSSDTSYEKIADRYSKSSQKDNFQLNLVRQENSGQGAARNKGLEVASGDYIIFVDQDDYIKNDYVEILLEKALETDSDIILSGYMHITNKGKIIKKVSLSNSEWCRYMNITPWGKLYRRDYLKEKRIKFLAFPLGEDIYFNITCFLNEPKISYTEYIGYIWLFNEESVSNTIHRTVTGETDVTILFSRILDIDNIESIINDEYFEYFVVKTGIYHILYTAPYTSYTELLKYKKRIFEWINNEMPNCFNNSNITFNKPKGESVKIRTVIFLYMIAYRWKLDNIILKILSLSKMRKK